MGRLCLALSFHLQNQFKVMSLLRGGVTWDAPPSCHQIPRLVQSQLHIFLEEGAGRMKEECSNKARVEKKLNNEDNDNPSGMINLETHGGCHSRVQGPFRWNQDSPTRLLS